MTKDDSITMVKRTLDETIRFVEHPSFLDRAESEEYVQGIDDPLDEQEFHGSYMPDEITRAMAKKMHHAAYRASKARGESDVQHWRGCYFRLRDRIVLGNRKLIFGAVKRKVFHQSGADDLIGECYIVMIRAVAAYNPWMGIRFSTYAYTCLMRALSRLNQRSMADRLANHLSLDHLLGEEPVDQDATPTITPSTEPRIDDYLAETHPLLSDREKTVLRRRFHLSGSREESTLEKVGRDLGLSKERVRQVQASALDKLRKVLVPQEIGV